MNAPFIPATRHFRFQLGEPAYDPNRNWTLRRILYLIRYIAYLLKNIGGDSFISLPARVSRKKTFLRAPDLMATRTLIANIGTDAPVTIFENGKIVALIAPGETRKLPLQGRLTLEARCEAGEETFLVITTGRRKPYPGEPYKAPYGQAIAPIGGDIL